MLARATDGPVIWRSPGDVDRARYRNWLEEAAEVQPMGSDLRLGLLGRAYREAISVGALEEADILLSRLEAECQDRFALSLTRAVTPAGLPDNLSSLVERMPLSWGGLLLQQGVHRILKGEARPSLEPVFLAAAEAATALRKALWAIGSDDGDAEDVAWVASAEAILCAAERGIDDISARLRVLGRSPGVGAVAERGAAIRRRAFVSLVNAGHHATALSLGDVTEPVLMRAESGATLLLDDELSTLFCAAMLEANGKDGVASRGVRLLRALRAACLRSLATRPGGSAEVLIWPAIETELLLLKRMGGAKAERKLLSDEVASIAARPNVPPPPERLRGGAG